MRLDLGVRGGGRVGGAAQPLPRHGQAPHPHRFRGSLHLDLLGEMQERVGGWLLDGSLVYPESAYDGLDAAPRAMADMLAGRTTGKTLVRL